MNYINTIKEGIFVANKNWQLILVQFLFMFFSFISLLAIVGIPLAIAFVIFGLDLTEILRQKDVIGVFHVVAGMLKKSLPIVLFVTLGFILYLASVIAMWIYAFAGTIGSLAKTILNGQKFALKTFWSEAKRLFFPVFIYTNISVFVFALLAMAMGILSESAKKIISLAEAQEATLAVFLGIFFFLVLLSVGIFLFFVMLGITLYGSGYLVFNRPRPLKAFRQIARYLYETPSAYLFLGILAAGYLIAGSLVVTVTSLLAMIPAVGPLLAMPFQLVTQAAHGYVSLVILSSVFLFYYRTGSPASAPESKADSDISQPPIDLQVQAPEAKDENPPE